MSKELILSMTVSIDGFVSGPNGETDWMFRSMSEEGREWLVEQFWKAGLLAIGHQSYQAMADFWPTADNLVARPMNEIPKAIFSRSGAISRPSMEKTNAALKKVAAADPSAVLAALESWLHPTVAGKDLAADVQRLKAEDGKPIVAIGGASFAASLIRANLVDVYRLSVQPVALGRGIPFFGALEAPTFFKLEEVKRFDSGAVVKTYRPS